MMTLIDTKLREKAHNHALTHELHTKGRTGSRFWKRHELKLKEIRLFTEQLNESDTSCSQPAEEWLLDHKEFIEEQFLVLKDNLSYKLLRNMPVLKESGDIRILDVCAQYVALTDGHVTKETFAAYIEAYQEISVLTLAEVGAVPVMLRAALIEFLSESVKVMKERHDVCRKVENVMKGVNTSKLSPEALKELMEKNGFDLPLPGSVMVHLVKHLREQTDHSATVAEWLMCKLENSPESLDRILSYEYQLQAGYQVTTGNVVTSLRWLSRWHWDEEFEAYSVVEQTLQKDVGGVYPKLDHASKGTLRSQVERLASRMHVPENLLALKAVELASEHADPSIHQDNGMNLPGEKKTENGVQQRAKLGCVSFYLMEAAGHSALRKRLASCSKPRTMPETAVKKRAFHSYFTLAAAMFLLAYTVMAWTVSQGAEFGAVVWIFLAAAFLLPASEWAVTLTHWIIEQTVRPSPLLRYDFSGGVPDEAATLVAVPVIWSSEAEVEAMVSRLELHYLANKDANIKFGILGDFNDSDTEKMPGDKKLIRTAAKAVQRLNETYSGSPFYLFHRRRVWNPAEDMWMGWERKRGKLVELVELIKGKKDTTFAHIAGDTAGLSGIRYIITLDSDTKLPFESAARMIGTLHLPANRPVLNDKKTRIIDGYGVLQPRVGMSYESASKSRFASLWAAEPGVDPYAFAVSDPYQDGMGEGIFTGKGIFDVDTFSHVLCDRIPENRLLSHDLLEGGFLRAGFMQDIELIDSHPARFISYQKRMHRWIRGDWQLLLWLRRKAENRRGSLLPVDLSILTRWQIIDNLRRSLMVPGLFAAFWAGLTILPGAAFFWSLLILVTIGLPVLRQLLTFSRIWRYPAALFHTAAQSTVAFLTLPYQTVVQLDAVFRSLYRLLISKRRLLEWTPAAEVDRNSEQTGVPVMAGMAGGYVLIAFFVFSLVQTGNTTALAFGLAAAGIWLTAPAVIRWLDSTASEKKYDFSASEQEELNQLGKETWSFYEDYVTEKDNWLPPDNVQIKPSNGVAHRTSPTNIGLYLASVLAAGDLGYISMEAVINRIEKTVTTVEQMVKWEGHLYNWYNTETLEPLSPRYISTVDSGNFAVCLIAVKEGVAEWLEAAHEKTADGQPEEARNPAFHLALSEEITPTGLNVRAAAKTNTVEDWYARGEYLIKRLEALVYETDFKPLYNHKARLFSLGYHAEKRQQDEILYDLMASEARQASFIAVALGQVAVSHWNALGRTMTLSGHGPVLLSWSGTMFEYLMPALFMRTYKGSVWGTTYEAAVQRQIAYARERRVPYGISESGYYAFDYEMNYQYRAFGVPGLGFKRGLEQDLVVSPYAAVLSLPFSKKEAFHALQQLEKIEARGKYGFYEAVDYTKARLPDGADHKVVHSYMAHHQGMIFLTLANALRNDIMVERFHRHKPVKAAELLLQERLPKKPRLVPHQAMQRPQKSDSRAFRHRAAVREFHSAQTRTPQVCLLTNGTFSTMVTNSGAGYSQYEGKAISRWQEDAVTDHWGSYMYIRDLTEDTLWSPSCQPCGTETDGYAVTFEPGRAVFVQETDTANTTMEMCVSPEWPAEVRRLTLINKGNETRTFEVTTFTELALADLTADAAHPAFSKLFIRTEYDKNTNSLLAGRRPRDADEDPLWAAHSLLLLEGGSESEPEYDTDRASFIGRGRTLNNPKGIEARLSGKTGSVADPAFVMRRRITLKPGDEVQLAAITAAARDKREVLETVRRFDGAKMVERAFSMAWTRTEVELRNLHISQNDAALFQTLAGHILYCPPLTKERVSHIWRNSLGQSSLWPYGISGDKPVVLVRVDSVHDMTLPAKLLTAHEYLRRAGVVFDLVMLNESDEGYHQAVQETLQHTAEQGVDRFGEGASHVYVIDAARLDEAEKRLLMSAARLTFHAWGPGLFSQLRLPDRKEERPEPPALKVTPFPAAESAEMSYNAWTDEETDDLLFFNGWGGFTQDGHMYKLKMKHGRPLPSPWINVLANEHFGCLISEMGTGYTWWRNSREFKLTPWSNDPVLDPPGEKLYIRDEDTGAVWSAAPEPGAENNGLYTVTHGRGFTDFEHEQFGISHTMSVYVPLHDPLKIIKISLKNESLEPRRMSLTYYAEWVLGVQRQPSSPFILTEWHEELGVMTAQNTYQEIFSGASGFLGIFSGKERKMGLNHSWTGDREEFIGRNGTLTNPDAMSRVRLSGRTGAFHEPCGAVQTTVNLQPDSEQDIYILLGCTESEAKLRQLVKKYSDAAVCEEALNEVSEYWDRILGQVQVETPSKEMDLLLNGWLLYQTLACRMWGRTAFYQSGGAYGYRDQLQDALSLLHTLPGLTRKQISLHASHQYEEGDVQHWWHEETAKGIRTLFSDDLLWLPYAVSRYVEHTGDRTILDDTAPYITSEPLKEGEHERYEETVQSAESGTIYEHCLRAIDKALERTGEHGLPLIGVGDWNDGMNLVGAEGRGESVWLGWFLCDILRRFEEVCKEQGDTSLATEYKKRQERLAEALDVHAWDGQWYRRAFTDNGEWLGSAENEECRIDAIAQAWSVISGAANTERAARAMASFDRELVDRELSVIRLLTPPFDETEHSPGYIQGYPPGIRENGAQYTHGVIWGIVACSLLGKGDQAMDMFHLLNPVTHTRTDHEVMVYKGEPYVMAADVYTADPHKGRAGWTWYTGAAGWMYQAGLEWILGIKRRGDELIIDPCLPEDWNGYRLTYRTDSAVYDVTVQKAAEGQQPGIVINGDDHDPGGGAAVIPLMDNNEAYDVTVYV